MAHLGDTSGAALSTSEKTKSGDVKILAQPHIHREPGACGQEFPLLLGA